MLTNTRGIGPNQALPAFDAFAAALEPHCAQLRIVAAEEFADLDAAALDRASRIIAVSENYTLPGLDFEQGSQIELLKALQRAAAERLIWVALRDPYQLEQLPELAVCVCSYSFRPCAAQAAVEALLGQITPHRASPVTVPGTEIAAAAL